MPRIIQEIGPRSSILFLMLRSQWTANSKVVIKNWGRAPGAPATIQSGDGVTLATQPVLLIGRRGVTFNGTTNYLTLGTAPTGLFSVAWCNGKTATVENALVTWNKIIGAGLYSGNLTGLILLPFITTPTQTALLTTRLLRECRLD